MSDMKPEEGTILASGVKATLESLEQQAPELQVDAHLDGDVYVETSIPVTRGPSLLRGGRFSVYVQTKVQKIKEAVGGVRFTKKF